MNPLNPKKLRQFKESVHSGDEVLFFLPGMEFSLGVQTTFSPRTSRASSRTR
jgi:hypothetical protein